MNNSPNNIIYENRVILCGPNPLSGTGQSDAPIASSSSVTSNPKANITR
jgi:hypothetical protein